MVSTVVLLEFLESGGVAKLSGSHVMKKYPWIDMWQKLHSYSGTSKWQKKHTCTSKKQNWLMASAKAPTTVSCAAHFAWKKNTLRWLFQWSILNVQKDGSKGWLKIQWKNRNHLREFQEDLPISPSKQYDSSYRWWTLGCSPTDRSGKWRFSSEYHWLLPGWGAFQGGLMFIQADFCSQNDSNSLGVILLPNNALCCSIYPLIKDNPENGTSVGSQDARSFHVPRNALHVPQFRPQKRYPSLPELSATLHGWPNAAAPAVQLGYGHSVANNERNQSLLNSIVVVSCMHDVCLANDFKNCSPSFCEHV